MSPRTTTRPTAPVLLAARVGEPFKRGGPMESRPDSAAKGAKTLREGPQRQAAGPSRTTGPLMTESSIPVKPQGLGVPSTLFDRKLVRKLRKRIARGEQCDGRLARPMLTID